MQMGSATLLPNVGHDAFPANRWPAAFRDAFRAAWPLYAILAAYLAAAIVTAVRLRASLIDSLVGYAGVMAFIALAGAGLAILVLLGTIGVRERPASPARRLVEELRRILTPERAARGIALLLSILVLQAIYVFFKPLIPRFAGFSWDPLFAGLDRALFFGTDPWRVLWPVLGNAPATLVINIVYHLWFFWMVLVWTLVAFAGRHRAANLRFFLAFILAWTVGGTLLAIFLSSAGPCYYGFVVDAADPFAPLLAGLDRINEHVPVFARGVQAMLWDGQTHPGSGKLAGVSAMPSMHCATAFLLTRIAFVHDRRLGIASSVMAGFILVGSVHLGWHYAVDGLAGFFLAWCCWMAAGRILVGEPDKPSPAPSRP